MSQLDSGNAAWILTSACLVLLMTPGVALFYGGMVRAKAVLNMLIMEAAALSVTMIIWGLWGWSIAYAGNSIGGVFGDPATGFLLRATMACSPPPASTATTTRPASTSHSRPHSP